MALFFGQDLEVFSFEETGVSKVQICFKGKSLEKEESKATCGRTLYLAPDGGFDVLLDKEQAKKSGICQSIILEVYFRTRV